MAYQVLARKWRPQTFAEVLGQGHIAVTLQNAIMRQRIGHAYLFVGPRGTGKTTTARIFAKALNCETPATDAQGRVEPCCQCRTCQEITAGTCLDVIEIDGASNNGVDNIRDLRETVQYVPTNGRRYKVYIIDEVHMLSTAAWNALLKTLEEPPEHIKFLFATTEAHKVLATILSRCQRFDLKRLEVPTIVERLHTLATQERIRITDAALVAIARAADGGMRDAQSITDQLVAFCGGEDDDEITEADVIEVFGLTSQAELGSVLQALVNHDAGALLQAVYELADRGRNLERLYGDLLLAARNLMICQTASDPARLLDLTPTEAAALTTLAQATPAGLAQRLVDALMTHENGLRNALNKRVFLETALMRAMREAHALRLDDFVTQLRRLQQGGALADVDQLPPPTPPRAPIPPPATALRPAAPPPSAPPAPARSVAAPLAPVSVSSPAPVVPPAPESVSPALVITAPTAAAVVPPTPVADPPPPVVAPASAVPALVAAPVTHPWDAMPDELATEVEFAREPAGDFDAGWADASPAPPASREPDPLPSASRGRDESARQAARQRLESHPLIRQLCELFAGKLVDVRITAPVPTANPG